MRAGVGYGAGDFEQDVPEGGVAALDDWDILVHEGGCIPPCRIYLQTRIFERGIRQPKPKLKPRFDPLPVEILVIDIQPPRLNSPAETRRR